MNEIHCHLKNGTEIVGPEIEAQFDPWLEFAGMFHGDPWIEDWKRSVEEYRQMVEDEPTVL